MAAGGWRRCRWLTNRKLTALEAPLEDAMCADVVGSDPPSPLGTDNWQSKGSPPEGVR